MSSKKPFIRLVLCLNVSDEFGGGGSDGVVDDYAWFWLENSFGN